MGSRSPWTCILWDVDGTIVDASDGILRRLKITLEHFGKNIAKNLATGGRLTPEILKNPLTKEVNAFGARL